MQQFSRFYGVEVITHEVSSLEFNVLTKSEGGLGLRRVVESNKATIMRHTWKFFAQAGSMGWLGQEKNLLRAILLKTKIPQKCSWGWRKPL